MRRATLILLLLHLPTAGGPVSAADPLAPPPGAEALVLRDGVKLAMGKSTACVPASARASRADLETFSMWSTEAAPMEAASVAPPMSANWPTCARIPRPCSDAAANSYFASSTVNAFRSM